MSLPVNLLIQLTAFPPLMGYGTCQTIAGFAFGVWHGWLIAVGGWCVLSVLTLRSLHC